MTKLSQNSPLDGRLDLSQESTPAANPDFGVDNLFRGARPLFMPTSERPSPITADETQNQLANIFANLQRLQNLTETPHSPAPDRAAVPKNTVENPASALFNKDSTDEQKLSAVRDLAKNGTKELTYRDASGNERKLRLEVEPASNGEMVHLFAEGADGKETAILRGISHPDGTWEHEQNQSGRAVDFKEPGYSQLIGGQPDASGAHEQSHREATPDGSNSPIDSDQSPDVPHATKHSHRRAKPHHSKTPKDSHESSEAPHPTKQSHRETTPDNSKSPTDSQHTTLASRGLEGTTGSIDRSQFSQELRDPDVMAAFAGRMRTEVGRQGEAAQVAFAEEVMNRAAARGQTLMEALSGGYYPTHHPGRSNNPEFIAAITKAWQQGTDTTHGATGNASGRAGFGKRGGHYDDNDHWVSPNQTVRINGERFGYEQQDLDHGWMKQYETLMRHPIDLASR